MPIHQLSAETINRIAAGEVIERPASVVKELIENAIDAGATTIEIVAVAGGLSLIRVSDDGIGMSGPDLGLAVERHATSKLAEEDLLNIATLGFRGEALPSIGAIAHLTVASRAAQEDAAHEIVVDRGAKRAVRPVALAGGTRVEVRELFSATPARLKFLKSERAENAAIAEVVKRIALAHPAIAFSLTTGERTGLRLPQEPEGSDGHLARLGRIMGRDFLSDALAVEAEREGARIRGFAGLPTLNRPDSSQQYLFVNGRPVRDRVLIGAVRAPTPTTSRADAPAACTVCDAAAARGRRQRAPDQGGGPLPQCQRRARPDGRRARGGLEAAGHRASERGGTAMIAALAPGQHAASASAGGWLAARRWSAKGSRPPQELVAFNAGAARRGQCAERRLERRRRPRGARSSRSPARGRASAAARNLHRCANPRFRVIVDQHAAHEQLVYERIKAQLADGGVARQALLIPVIVELDDEEVAGLAEAAEPCSGWGCGSRASAPAPSWCARCRPCSVMAISRASSRIWRGKPWVTAPVPSSPSA